MAMGCLGGGAGMLGGGGARARDIVQVVVVWWRCWVLRLFRGPWTAAGVGLRLCGCVGVNCKAPLYPLSGPRFPRGCPLCLCFGLLSVLLCGAPMPYHPMSE